MPSFGSRMIRVLVYYVQCKTETLAVAREFTFFTGTSNGSESCCTVFMYKFFMFPNFGRIVGVPGVL